MKKRPEKGHNNLWYHLEDSDAAVVFVHGIFSDSRNCWYHEDKEDPDRNCYWPDLILEDTRLKDISIYLGGYFTSIDSGEYTLKDCAKELYNGMGLPCLNSGRNVFSKKIVIFICHSMGGVVVRYMLEKNKEEFMSKKIGLILIASPSTGSKDANRLGLLIKYFKNKSARQLKKMSPDLVELDGRFKDLVNDKSIPNLVGVEAYENKFIIHRKMLRNREVVVTKESAGRYFGDPTHLPGTDHFTVAKPNGLDHPSHTLFLDFIRKNFKERLSERVAVSGSLDEVSADPLFDNYEIEHEQYYLERDVDQKIRASLESNGVWLIGESGLGKTCALRRNIKELKANYIYISLATYLPQNTKSLFYDFHCELFQYLGLNPKFGLYSVHRPSVINETSEALIEHLSGCDIFIHIDEISSRNNKLFEDFIDDINALIIKYSSSITGGRVRFTFSTIANPSSFLKKDHKKILEKIKFIQLEKWNNVEISDLFELIAGALSVAISKPDAELVIQSAGGSPRFLKVFFRNLLNLGGQNRWEITAIIKQTVSELA